MTSVAEFRREFAEPWASAHTVRVAVAGCGAVGSAFLNELTSRLDALQRRRGRRVELTGVLVRDITKPRPSWVASLEVQAQRGEGGRAVS